MKKCKSQTKTSDTGKKEKKNKKKDRKPRAGEMSQ